MFDRSYKLKLDNYEVRLLIRALNEFRNQIIEEGLYHTDAIDELYVKVVHAIDKKC